MWIMWPEVMTKLFGEFCRKRWHETDQCEYLGLNIFGYEATRPDVEVPMSKAAAIPDPESDFSF